MACQGHKGRCEGLSRRSECSALQHRSTCLRSGTTTLPIHYRGSCCSSHTTSPFVSGKVAAMVAACEPASARSRRSRWRLCSKSTRHRSLRRHSRHRRHSYTCLHTTPSLPPPAPRGSATRPRSSMPRERARAARLVAAVPGSTSSRAAPSSRLKGAARERRDGSVSPSSSAHSLALRRACSAA